MKENNNDDGKSGGVFKDIGRLFGNRAGTGAGKDKQANSATKSVTKS